MSILFLTVIFLPTIAALVLWLGKIKLPDLTERWAARFAMSIAIIDLLLCLPLISYSLASDFVYSLSWFPEYGLNFSFHLTGINSSLILFSSLVFPIIFSSALSKQKSVSFYSMLLLIETALLGSLMSTNLVVFYFFYELLLFPLYFLLYIDSDGELQAATFKFILYTLLGSLLMLLSILTLGVEYYQQYGELSFDLLDLIKLSLAPDVQIYLMLGFFVAFAVKAPVFPFHTWQPAIYSKAPNVLSVLMAGLLFQVGIYGLYRFMMLLFPNAYMLFANILALLGVFAIFYAALIAWRQTSIKKLLAYASISHVGFSIFGLALFNYAGVVGGLYLIISHIIIATGLFILATYYVDRLGSDDIESVSGLASKAPIFSFFFVVFSLASISLPLTMSFVGEFLVLNTGFGIYPVLTLFALLGVIFGAVYMLNLVRKILFGQASVSFEDLNSNEISLLVPLALLILLMGVYPKPVLTLLNIDVQEQVDFMTKKSINYPNKKPIKLREGMALASAEPDQIFIEDNNYNRDGI